jgi:hypothetical protein
MKKVKLSLLAFSAVIAMVVGMASSAFAQQFITIGTGGVSGVYYPTGGAICSLFNKMYKEAEGISCSVESTGGSIYNINTIRGGELDFGVAQSDWQYHAYNGTSKFEDKGPFKELRAVFSVHPEPFTVVARADSGIKTFEDLKGKRVNVGNPGSGQRGTMEVLLGAMGWIDPTDEVDNDDDDNIKEMKKVFSSVSELKSAEQSSALCDNKIDAIVFTVGHPSGSISEATTSCDSVLVEVSGPIIDKLVKDNDYYRTAKIPLGKLYPNTKNKTKKGEKDEDRSIKTFGVGATFVSSTKTSEDMVYKLVKSVFENFDKFKELHPAFAELKPEEMIKDGLSAPLHKGAAKYYKEKGWL